MDAITPLPLAILDRTEVRCWRLACRASIVRVGVTGPASVSTARFSGEWRQDEGVWRITDYAKAMRRRQAAGAMSVTRRKRWTDPTRWKPVLEPLPCAVECPACGELQSISAQTFVSGMRRY